MEYVIVWDAGVPEGDIYKTLDEAKAAREDILAKETAQMRDFCHIATLTYVDLGEQPYEDNYQGPMEWSRDAWACRG